ncbi:hypothetical protein PACILC2_22750 [Paenibacillus cisolokensis]|uniref:Uncharacterized protein n=1 Tax=Paenibacillus cisolokensis TaxID=1658519 RepID=A0ABQ4N6A6_9BACL|nr:hypothetical protein [Paenibacillus cisolokensis]GIQ63707.1 hypothetical protein PACILC2_22750 [Paenibacillus cisolokensis]
MAYKPGDKSLSYMRQVLYRSEKSTIGSRLITPITDSPPTITLGERNGVSQITNSVHITAANPSTGVLNPVYRYVGDPQRAGTSYPDNGYVKNTAVTTTNSNGSLIVEFVHYGAAFEIYEKGQGGKYRLAIDEGDGYKYVTEDAQSMAPADGGTYNRLIDFGSAKSRGVRLEISNAFSGASGLGRTIRFIRRQYCRVLARSLSVIPSQRADRPARQ